MLNAYNVRYDEDARGLIGRRCPIERAWPGDRIYHEKYGGEGIVVGHDGDLIAVLWSVEPAYPSALWRVQPMTAPVGNIFYLDFVYGDKPTGASQVNPRLADGDDTAHAGVTVEAGTGAADGRSGASGG